MRKITVDQRRTRLGSRHALAIGAQTGTVEDAARAVVGLHSSDPASVFLSARARMADPSVEAVEVALYEDRTLVRVLGMRCTMFVVPAQLVPVLYHACAHTYAARERRRLVRLLEEGGITTDAESWIRRVETDTLAALEVRGASVATELSSDVPELKVKITFGEGKKWGGQVGVSTRILFLLATEGRIVRARPRGSWTSSQYRWALMDSWLAGAVTDMAVDDARAELARRWLAAFGPGTAADLKWWTGWTVAQVAKVLDRIEAVEVAVDGAQAFVPADDEDPASANDPWAALLPSLDPTVMGWFERDWYLGVHRSVLFDRNGNAGATIWWDGRIVGGWAQRSDGEIVYRLLEDVGADAEAVIAAQAESLVQWLGETRVTPRFRTPLERELLA